MKIRELPCKATTNPNNSVYRVLGSAYEKTSNGFLIKNKKNQTQNIITRPDYRLAGDKNGARGAPMEYFRIFSARTTCLTVFYHSHISNVKIVPNKWGPSQCGAFDWHFTANGVACVEKWTVRSKKNLQIAHSKKCCKSRNRWGKNFGSVYAKFFRIFCWLWRPLLYERW